MTDQPPEDAMFGEILRRIDDLVNLCVKRFDDNRAHHAAVEALTEQLRQAGAGPFREYAYQFVMSTALVVDRLDQYTGSDPAFAASIRDELLDVLSRYGVFQVNTHGQFDAARHEVVQLAADASAPAGAVLTTLRRGYSHDGWVFRPARVVINELPS